MNEHVGKPFEMAKLVSLLIRLTGFQADAVGPPLAVPEPAGTPSDLPDVTGLDLATALARMSGLRPLYVRTARDFHSILDSAVEALRAALAAGDFKLAQMQLHTLKGNAATLGAMPLAERAAELERLCSQGLLEPGAAALAGLQDLIHTSQQQLTQAILGLAPAVKPNEVPAAVPQAELMPLDDALRTLDALAMAADLSSIAFFETHRAVLSRLPETTFMQMEEAIQTLALETVHALCSQAMAPAAA
jgi:HPt (histidine-containing phosphotransfer) domain-containing protein